MNIRITDRSLETNLAILLQVLQRDPDKSLGQSTTTNEYGQHIKQMGAGAVSLSSVDRSMSSITSTAVGRH
jgi:hypothetical protein